MKTRIGVSLLLFSLVFAPLARAQSSAASATTTAPLSGPNQITVGGITLDHIVPVADRYKNAADAAKVTDGNGIDQVYFQDAQTGKLYLAYGPDGHLPGISDLKEGFVGNYRGHIVTVVHVDSEINTFGRGFAQAWVDAGKAVKSTVFDNFLTTLATGATGVAVAAILNSGKAAAAAAAATAAPATTGAIVATTTSVLGSLVPVLEATAIAAVIGTTGYSLYQGIHAQLRKHDMSTISMVAAQDVNQLNDPPATSEVRAMAPTKVTTTHPASAEPFADLPNSPHN